VSNLISIRLATRRSPLAIRQAELTAAWLKDSLSGYKAELLPMSTSGDERQHWSLENKGGKGLFTLELEQALLQKNADLAVHSAKDLPTQLPENLCIAGYLPRADPRDVLVCSCPAENCKTFATSSPRRRAQLQAQFPGVDWTTLRGNVGTRLRKLSEGVADATVLAAAGLARLAIVADDFPNLSFSTMSINSMVPAPGQGAIALECRQDDFDKFAPLLCPQTNYAVTIEKRLLSLLGGGCQTPIGAHYFDNTLHVFHPLTGKTSLPLTTGLSIDAIDSILTNALIEWQLISTNP
jgi:hydroxymethylbilane synthase